MIRKAIGKQLTCLRRGLDAVDSKLSLGKPLTTRQMEHLNTIRTSVNSRSTYTITTTHSVPDQVVSVNRPFVQLIDVQYNDEKISSM